MVSSSGGTPSYVYQWKGPVKAVEWSERVVSRFLAKIKEDPDTGCWNWTGFRDPKGYGRFQYGTRDARLAYNVSYPLFISHVSDELELDHLCRNTSCVNPWHLEPVTPAVNQARKAEARTHCPQGHPYNDENTYTSPSGAKVCRTCRKRTQRVVKERLKAERAARGPVVRSKPTHCKRGHAFDEVNTYVYRGFHHCRACRAQRSRDAAQVRR